jgi:hypothetical protein
MDHIGIDVQSTCIGGIARSMRSSGTERSICTAAPRPFQTPSTRFTREHQRTGLGLTDCHWTAMMMVG